MCEISHPVFDSGITIPTPATEPTMLTHADTAEFLAAVEMTETEVSPAVIARMFHAG